MVPVVFSSFDVLLGGCGRSHISHRSLVLTRSTAWNRKYQRRRTEGYQIKTLRRQHRSRTVHHIRCKVRNHNHLRQFFFCSSHFHHYPFSHEEVMGTEIEFYKNSTERDSKSLMNHITRTTSSSSEAPFTPTSLSLVYDKLVERVFTQPTASDSSLGKPSTTECARSHEPCTPTVIQQPDPTPVAAPSIPTQQSPNPSTVPVPELESEAVPLGAIWLECFQCSQRARLRDLFNGLRCPRCPSRPRGKGRPFMQCPACKLVRGTPKEYCVRAACQARFV